MFLAYLARSYSLASLQKLSIPCHMNWNVAKEQDGVGVDNFGTINAYQHVSSRSITGLLPGRFKKDYPVGEVL